MSTTETNEEEDKKPWIPQVITGGKEPPISYGGNWLIYLDLGSVFLVKKKAPAQGNIMDQIVLQLFKVVFKKGKAVRLQHPETMESFFFDSDAFCKIYDKFEELEVVSDE